MTVSVRDYMVLEVEHIPATTTVGEATRRLMRSRHHGFPVTDDVGRLVGFVSAKELLRHAADQETPLGQIIRPGTYTATPDTALDDAARIMFRFGLRDLPIIDDSGRLCGVLEPRHRAVAFRARVPAKADTLKRLLSERYNLPFSFQRGLVPIDRLTPTQWKVYEDELEGRRYELERGFAEPVLVVQKGDSCDPRGRTPPRARRARDGPHAAPCVRPDVRIRPTSSPARRRGSSESPRNTI